MRYDAQKEHWMSMEGRGVRGEFSDVRIKRETVPEPFHIWELADAECDGMPCRYRPSVLVNFFGTFITSYSGFGEEKAGDRMKLWRKESWVTPGSAAKSRTLTGRYYP